MNRQLRKKEFLRRLKHGNHDHLVRRLIMKRYLKMTDEQINDLIYEPLERKNDLRKM